MAARVMIMAGGTGGHVFPALAVARWLKEKGQQVTWMGTPSGIEAKIVPEAGIEIDWLNVSGLRGKGWLLKLVAPLMLIKACWQAAVIIYHRKPDVVLGLGGFASGPGGVMAWLLRTPLVIHEQNTVPGTTNRLLANIADKILEAFPASFEKKRGAIFTGNPIRKEMLSLGADKSAKQAVSPKNILIVGGSLGALILNEVVPAALKIVAQDRAINIIHQAGKSTVKTAQLAYKENKVDADIQVFITDMKQAYEWADIVICRAGAMTISELTITGLPAILVPLPSAIDDHQTTNAQYLAEKGAGILIKQNELNPARLAKEVKAILKSAELYQDMAQKAQQLAQPDATELVAKACLELAL